MTACTDRPATTDTGGSTGSATSTGDAPTTTTTPTGSDGTTTADDTTTTEPDATTGTTGDPVQTTGTTTGEPDDTTGTSTGTTAADTDTPQPACPSLCERTVVHEGDLSIGPGDSTADLACVVRVTGNLFIHGEHDEATLEGLSGLEQVDGLLRIEGSKALTGLAPFSCLRDVDTLQLLQLPALVDVSALSGLQSIGRFGMSNTAVVALPEFASPQLGLHTLELMENAALKDLDALTTWSPGASLDVWIEDMGSLTSVAGLAKLLTDVTSDEVSVILADAPKLPSLVGLEPLVTPQKWLHLIDLPLVSDLKPLANLQSVGGLTLSDMPLVKSLAGLEKLKSVDLLVLGGCVNGGPDAGGMDGLTSLAGLDSLASVSIFGIANSDKLSSLTGAPLLKGKLWQLDVVNDPLLDQADVDALVTQLGQPPESSCVGDWNECQCVVIMPP